MLPIQPSVALPIPVLTGETTQEKAPCSTCGVEATATIEFVACAADEAGRLLGTWAPAVYFCPSGHITMECEL